MAYLKQLFGLLLILFLVSDFMKTGKWKAVGCLGLGVKSFPKKQRQRGRRKEAYQKQQQIAGRNIEGVSILTVEIVQKISARIRSEKGARATTSSERQNDLGGIVLANISTPKNMIQERP